MLTFVSLTFSKRKTGEVDFHSKSTNAVKWEQANVIHMCVDVIHGWVWRKREKPCLTACLWGIAHDSKPFGYLP